jgi:sialate O-acetylesterase
MNWISLRLLRYLPNDPGHRVVLTPDSLKVMPMPTRKLLLLLALSGTPVLAAELRLPHLFSDGMVLQRDRPVPVWGWAGSGESVTVRVAERTAAAVTDAQGRWSTTLDPLPAGGPVDFEITGPSGRLAVRDVLVGDVFQVSGQSNAAMSMGSARRFPGTDEDLATGLAPEIRIFQVPWSQFSAEPRDDVDARWAEGGKNDNGVNRTRANGG